MPYEPLRVYNSCIEILSKPNLHRLRELVQQLVWMWPHVSWCGEITLEKAHQGIKYSLKKSNNKDEHTFVMDSMRFSHWQHRLAECYEVQGTTRTLILPPARKLLLGSTADHLSEGSSGCAEIDSNIRRLLNPQGPLAVEIHRQSPCSHVLPCSPSCQMDFIPLGRSTLQSLCTDSILRTTIMNFDITSLGENMHFCAKMKVFGPVHNYGTVSRIGDALSIPREIDNDQVSLRGTK